MQCVPTWSMEKPRQPPLSPALLLLPGRGIHTVCQVGGSWAVICAHCMPPNNSPEPASATSFITD